MIEIVTTQKGNRNSAIILMKFIATFLITYSHMGLLFPKYRGLITGGAIGDGLFFFCSSFTLFLGRQDNIINWYKRRINRIYPTIIMWALLSSIFFHWEWKVTDLLTTPKYWFIPCIMVYYIIFYIIRQYLFQHLKITFAMVSIIIVGTNFFILDQNHSVMYAQVSFMKVYYFMFMLIGAMTAVQDNKKQSFKKAGSYTLIGLITYYACMWIYKISPFFCKFQILSLIPLLFAIYWIYQLCNTETMHKSLKVPVWGQLIYLISALTLEVYMVQYAIFTERFNSIFPLNIVFIYILIFGVAYLLKCTSKLFSQIFSDSPINIKKIYRV